MIGAELAGALAAIGALAALGAALTILPRLARIPGGAPAAALAGGLLAGILLGPGVLGRALPDMHQSLILGGADEAEALALAQRRAQADILALVAIGASPAAIAEARAAHAEELAPLRDALRDAQRRRRIAVTDAGFGALLLWILLTALAAPIALAARRSDARIALAGAVLSLLVTGACVALLSRWLLGASIDAAIAFGAGCALTMWTFDHRALARDTLRRASAPAGWIVGGVLGLLAIAVVTDSFEAIVVALALVVLSLSLRARRPDVPRSRRARRLCWRAAWTICAPTLVAVVASQLDFAALVRTADFWIATAIAAVFSHDGRWLGALLAHRIVGAPDDRADLWQRSGVVLDLGVGALQCAAALLILEQRAAPAEIIGSLLVSAVIIELVQPIRQPIARWMDESMGRLGAS